MTNFEAEIQKHEEAIKKLKFEKEASEQNVDEELYEIAIALHKKFCKQNHIDGCGWSYEVKKGVHDWNDYSHKRWLEQAKQVKVLMNKYNLTLEGFIEVKGLSIY